jgi:O-acetyl-ADP-ribose deacetylase (regulator of RNase III)
MLSVKGDIGELPITIEQGSMTAKACDTYIVPHFDSHVSGGGVARAVCEAGGKAGVDAYGEIIAQHNGHVPYGESFTTLSGGGNSKYLTHIVSVGSGRDSEFAVIQKAICNALASTARHGIKSLTIPALGTGAVGSLTPRQSAQAIMSAISEYAANGGRIDSICIVLSGPESTFHEFATVLQDKSYVNPPAQSGQKTADLAEWTTKMNRDLSTSNQPKRTNS